MTTIHKVECDRCHAIADLHERQTEGWRSCQWFRAGNLEELIGRRYDLCPACIDAFTGPFIAGELRTMRAETPPQTLAEEAAEFHAATLREMSKVPF